MSRKYSRRYTSVDPGFGLTVIALILAFVACVFVVGQIKGTEATFCATVTAKDVVATSESSDYLVWVEECETGRLETLAMNDSYTYGIFNSSDRYGAVEVGETYEMTVAGWRIPLLSNYRFIVSFE